MDINSLMSALLSDGSINEVSQKAGVSPMDAASVLAAALPSLLNGAAGQAENRATAESFHEACGEHAGRKTAQVDLDEGEKIVQHLLGSDEKATEEALARKTGLPKAKTALILAAAAPLIMKLLGQFTTSNNSSSANSTASLITSLLGGNTSSNAGVNPLVTAALAGVLGNAMGGQSSSQGNSLLGSLLGAAAGGQQSGGMLGSLLGGSSQPAASGSAGLLNSLMGAALGGMSQPQSSSQHNLHQAHPQQQSAGAGLGDLLMSLLK